MIDGVQKIAYKRIYFISSHIHKYEGGGLMLCPDAKFDDGKLDICVIGNISKIKLLFLLPTAFRGKYIKYKAVDIIRCNTISIQIPIALRVHADGESVGKESSIIVKSLHDKITIITGIFKTL